MKNHGFFFCLVHFVYEDAGETGDSKEPENRKDPDNLYAENVMDKPYGMIDQS